MSDFKTFDGEHILTSSDDQTIILTTHRIRYQKIFDVKSIMLNHVAGIEIRYHSQPWLAFLGGIAIIGGIIGGMTEDESFFAACAVGSILIAIYFLTRRHSIIINSDGKTTISFLTKGMARESALDFVNQVEKAIANYSAY